MCRCTDFGRVWCNTDEHVVRFLGFQLHSCVSVIECEKIQTCNTRFVVLCLFTSIFLLHEFSIVSLSLMVELVTGLGILQSTLFGFINYRRGGFCESPCGCRLSGLWTLWRLLLVLRVCCHNKWNWLWDPLTCVVVLLLLNKKFCGNQSTIKY